MRIEHLAYMTQDPPAVAEWYVEHLGFTIKRQMDESPFAYFLADGSGKVMLEIYNNPAATVPDYAAMDPLVLHLAFVSADVEADRDRLIAAGATAEGDLLRADNGDVLAMLRDPWGFAIQLAKRGEPMV